MIYRIKQVIIIILILAIAGLVILNFSIKKETKIIPKDNTVVNTETPRTYNLCYYKGTKTTSGYYDISWLKLNTTGDKVTGEFDNLPAEKDSKVGDFEGTVGPLDQNIMARHASVWWNSFAEGMRVKEELAIQFGDGSATVGFGEMIDRGDGVYVYKDKTNLYWIPAINQIDCDTLDEKLFTEKYVRDNIKTIATNKPILGGSWYVTSVVINPIAHTGEIVYEDGHIQSKANIIYTYQNNPQKYYGYKI
jgi:hypothetical protein